MSRTKKAERFLLARIALYLAGGASAAVGIYGWTTSNDATSVVLAIFTGLSALIVPLSMEVVGKSGWSAFLIPATLLFGGLNSYSFDHAVEVRIEQPRKDAYLATLAPLKLKADAADQRVTTTQTKLDAFPALVLTPDMPKGRVETQTASWKTLRAPLEGAVIIAKADATAAAKTYKTAVDAYLPMAAKEIVWTASVAIDITLAFALAGISLVRASITKRHETARKADLAVKRKAKAKAVPKKPVAKPMDLGAILSPAERRAMLRVV